MYYSYQKSYYLCSRKQKESSMAEKTEKRGGRRSGAGRPKGDSRLFSFRCSGELAEKIGSMENRTEFINASLSRALDETEGLSRIGKVIKPSGVAPMHLPYFDQRVTAGFPIPLDNDERSQDIELLRMLCPHPEASYLIRVKGDSMIDAGVMNGDIIIVDKSNREPSPKEIAVCEINGEYTLKHFVKDGETGWLIPANPAYKKREITPEDEFCVWGTVTYIIHKARD